MDERFADDAGQELHGVHMSITDGAESQLSGMPFLYVGIEYRVPYGELEEAQRVFEDTGDPAKAQEALVHDNLSPDDVLAKVRDAGYQIAPETVLERFDSIDIDTGDIIVLVRVPVLPAPPGMNL